MRMLLAGLIALLFVLPAAAEERSYVTAPSVRERGLDSLEARLGQGRPLVSLLFTPDAISVVAQPDSGPGFAQWQVRRVDLWLGNLHWVSGPTPVANTGIVDEPRGAYYRRDEIDLGRFDAVVAAAIAYAQLEHGPVIEAVEIARDVSILPRPAYGEIRWTVRLRTADERAIVYANARGEVFGGDLSETHRVETLDLYAQDDWPMAEAQARLAAVLGDARVHEVRVHENQVSVTADHPTDSGLQRDYMWDLSGVRQGFVDTPNLVTLGMGGIATFPFDALDFTALPAIKAAARAAFGAPDAAITEIAASQPTDRAASELRVLWEVAFREANGDAGEVWLDTHGNVVEVKLPESRLPVVGPWLAPATVIDTLRRIGTAFGPDAKLSEITINDTQASIDIEDPQAPGEVAHFLMDAREVQRFGTGSFFASLDAANVFTPRDLEALDVATLSALVARTEERLRMAGGEVFRFTFSRHALIMDPGDNRLMVEIRYGNERAGTGGWITFLLDGTQTDELLP